MSNMECPRHLDVSEIFQEWGNEEFMEKCSSCNGVHYSGGIMTCEVMDEKFNEQRG